MIKTPISNCYADAKDFLKIKDLDKARDKADEGLVYLASQVYTKKLKDEDIIEGSTVKLWYERLWIFLENNGLMLDSDEDHKPEQNYFWDKLLAEQ